MHKMLLVFVALSAAYKVPLISCASVETRVPEPKTEPDSASAVIRGIEANLTEGASPLEQPFTDDVKPTPEIYISIQTDDQLVAVRNESHADYVSSQPTNAVKDSTSEHIDGEIENENPASITDKGGTGEAENTISPIENTKDEKEAEIVPKMVNMPKQISVSVGSEPSGSTTNNAHTITSSDFAELTVASGKNTQEQSSSKIDITEVKPGTQVELPIVKTNDANFEEISPVGSLNPDTKNQEQSSNKIDITEVKPEVNTNNANVENISPVENLTPVNKNQEQPSSKIDIIEVKPGTEVTMTTNNAVAEGTSPVGSLTPDNKNQEQSSNKIDITEVKPGTEVVANTIVEGTSPDGSLNPENKNQEQSSKIDITEVKPVMNSNNAIVEGTLPEKPKPQQTVINQNKITENEKPTSGNESLSTNISVEPSAGTNAVSDVANRMTDELKVYSNDVVLAWNDETGRGTGWTAEAAGELRMYMDKIVIAQAVNPDCVLKDVGKHEARQKALHDVLESCGTSIKREEWKELQEKTKEALNTINDMVQEQGGGDIALRKLQEFDMEAVKQTLSMLKEKSMKRDEEDFKNCIDAKPEKVMIEDTLKDIMRIKNNCVG